MSNVKIEGYWWSEREPQFPKPEHSNIPFENKDKVIEKLKDLQINRLKEFQGNRRVSITHFKGFSICRCCKQSNGSGEYSHKNWKWPEGLLHYIEAHNVRPSDDFLKEVLNM